MVPPCAAPADGPRLPAAVAGAWAAASAAAAAPGRPSSSSSVPAIPSASSSESTAGSTASWWRKKSTAAQRPPGSAGWGARPVVHAHVCWFSDAQPVVGARCKHMLLPEAALRQQDGALLHSRTPPAPPVTASGGYGNSVRPAFRLASPSKKCRLLGASSFREASQCSTDSLASLQAVGTMWAWCCGNDVAWCCGRAGRGQPVAASRASGRQAQLIHRSICWTAAPAAHYTPLAPLPQTTACTRLKVSSSASRWPGARPRSTATLSANPNSWQLVSSSSDTPASPPDAPPAAAAAGVVGTAPPATVRTENTSSWLVRRTTKSGWHAAAAPPGLAGGGRVSHAAAH